MKLFSEDTLSHYGIQGQKWGERRWQNPDGTFNEAGKERYFGKSGSNYIKNVSKLNTVSDVSNMKINKIRKNSIFDFKTKKIEKEIENRQKTEEFDSNVGFYLKNKNDISIDDDIKNTNPYYNALTLSDGFKNNCPLVGATYVLRRKGYDVSANFMDNGLETWKQMKNYVSSVFGKKSIQNYYETDAKYPSNVHLMMKKNESFNKLDKIIKNMKDKDVGILSMKNAFYDGMGHIINFEKKGKDIYIIDAQDGTKRSYNDFKKDCFNENSTGYGVVITGAVSIDLNKIDLNNTNALHNIAHSEETLAHYGIQGQKWGERRWQNPDGTFNEAGKERYFGSKGNKRYVGLFTKKYTFDDYMKDIGLEEYSPSQISKDVNKIVKESEENIKKFKEINEQYKKEKELRDKRLNDMIKQFKSGSYNNIRDKGENIINKLFKNDKKTNIQIGKKIDKEIQQVMKNKDKYSEQEYKQKLFDLTTEKNIYNQNLKPINKNNWINNFKRNFSDTTSSIAGEKLGRTLMQILLG